MKWKSETILVLTVHVVPGSRKTEFADIINDALRILVKAAPTDNEANEALIKFLSKEFKAPQSNIKIISGRKSRHKVIEIEQPRRLPDIIKNSLSP